MKTSQTISNRPKVSRLLTKITVGLVFQLFFSGCSPTYVLKASWEETKILWSKRAISEVLNDSEIDKTTKDKLEMVEAARSFGKNVGLLSKGTYEEYAIVNRDVLVWVLTASPKTQLQSKTWWFPVVGSVPYKGFFEKADAEALAKEISSEGFDTSVRPSLAFSTLGWFKDPLLSTILKLKSISLIETVFHETLHSNVWIKNHVSFNETMANATGLLLAKSFFCTDANYQSAEQCQLAKEHITKNLAYSGFLKKLVVRLQELYQSEKSEEEKIKERDETYLALLSESSKLKIDKDKAKTNNATILGSLHYFDRIELFFELAELCKQETSYLEALSEVKNLQEREKIDPYLALEKLLTKMKNNKQQKEFVKDQAH